MAGYFVALEGIEGSGKSTVARKLATHFGDLGRAVTLTREPGGTEIGERIRDVLLDRNAVDISAEAETLLFAASRAQLVTEIIQPALARGDIVVVDRFTDSTLAYQCGGRGLPFEAVKAIQALATGGLEPDVKLLLDVPVSIGLQRRFATSDQTNRMDRESLAFHERVREAYLSLASADSERWRIIDASRPQSDVWSEVLHTMEGSGFREIAHPSDSGDQHAGNSS